MLTVLLLGCWTNNPVIKPVIFLRRTKDIFHDFKFLGFDLGQFAHWMPLKT